MMVLGAMLTSINALNLAAASLAEGDFYFNEHKLIYRVLRQAYSKDLPADVHLVGEELKRMDKLQAAGGIAYLATLAQYVGTSAYVEEYVKLVHNKALLRRMIDVAQRVEMQAFDEPKDVIGALDQAQQLFFEIGQSVRSREGAVLRDVLEGVSTEDKTPFVKKLEARQEKYQQQGDEAPGITGLPTHFYDLDNLINGLGRSHLIILAGRPAMGKTALAVNIAENVCFKSGKAVGIFSLEMNAEELVQRLICSAADVDIEKVARGSLSGEEYGRVYETVEKYKSSPLIIDDQAGMNINDLRARARRMKEAYDLQLIVIDYLQLLTGSSSRGSENRQVEISEISRQMKTLARELNIPVICSAQLSRKVEERVGHRPLLSDLRESGSIEQDADIVMFLLRRDYYDANDKPGQAEVIVAKNRHGAIGSVHLAFRKELAQFGSLSRTSEQEDAGFAGGGYGDF